jgi:DNA-binding LytR/AlgR family response regulator
VCAESADNYVKIWYEEGSQLKMKMMRLTLKKLENIFKSDPLVLRCHRTYIANIHFVTAFSGNAQGLKLEISIAPDILIPVSRTMVPAIKALLNSPG